MVTTPQLEEVDRALLSGAFGPAAKAAMAFVARYGAAVGAERFLSIEAAHIDGCLYHGQASLDFVRHFAALGGKVNVPTTLNVGSVDLMHPERQAGLLPEAASSRALMEAYVGLGCKPSFTCAPYQLRQRPQFGQHVAWAESNAIVFANSVLGARTARYGDFIDIACALTGRAPAAGLHLDANRKAALYVDATNLAPAFTQAEAGLLPAALGYWLGDVAGLEVSVIDKLPRPLTEDELKAIGATAASSGAVALFHVAGSTPEAPEAAAVLASRWRTLRPTLDDMRAARQALGVPERGAPVSCVSLGTPHYSLSEFAGLMPLLAGKQAHPDVEFYISTSRFVLSLVKAKGWLPLLEAFGARLVVDTCTYVTPMVQRRDGLALTTSGKWAHYAPGNIGVRARLASLGCCVRSAVTGKVEAADDDF